MNSVARTLGISVLALLALAARAQGQYMYMDTNGDGVWSVADVMNPNGTPTIVDVYLDTNHNRDGSVAACDSGDPDSTLGIWNSYAVHAMTPTGAVTFSNFVNRVAAFHLGCVLSPDGFVSDSTQMAACQAGESQVPTGGLARLFTVTVTALTGSPSLQIVPSNNLDENPTSFGTPCGGLEFDNTYKLGVDWFDTNGVNPAPGGNAVPVLSAPLTANGIEGQSITITATATDADGSNVLTITATGFPSSLTLTTTPGPSPASATLSGTLGLSDQGDHIITWSASDGIAPPVTAMTTLSVANVDRPPVVTAPASVSGSANTPLMFSVSASDPDADAISSLTASPLPTGASFTTSPARTSGTLSWTPTSAQVGSQSVMFTASNMLAASATTTITVDSASTSPLGPIDLTTGGSTYNAPDGTIWRQLVGSPVGGGVYDPFLRLRAAPVEQGMNTDSGVFGTYDDVVGIWTHGVTMNQLGVVTVGGTDYFSLSLDLNESTLFSHLSLDALQIYTLSGPSTLTSIEAVQGAGGTLRFDLDGIVDQTVFMDYMLAAGTGHDDVQVLIPTSYFVGANGSDQVYLYCRFGATGTAIDGFDFTSDDGFEEWHVLEGTTPPAPDSPPVVTSPPTATVDEGFLLSFNVTAADPDGDAIVSLTGDPLPFGAAFTVNAAKTAGTFGWTPSFTQAGSYVVVFTASNALSDTSVTVITVHDVDRAPAVVAPPAVSVDENMLTSFTVSASDPDGDPIVALSMSPLPAGAGFTSNASHTSGTFTWLPSFSDSGTYSMIVSAQSACRAGPVSEPVCPTGAAPTVLSVHNVDRNPSVSVPDSESINEGELLSFVATATDPDGDAIPSFTCSLPSGATFTTNVSNTQGTFLWTPTFDQAGLYSVTLSARNACRAGPVSEPVCAEGSATTVITVVDVDRAPVVAPLEAQAVEENVALTFVVSAIDPDGQSITSFQSTPLPSGASFTTNAMNTSGTFGWTPDFTQAGSYPITFQASNALTGATTTVITVSNVDRPPAISAPETKYGTVGQLMAFGVAASDPDGESITSLVATPLPSGATFTTDVSNSVGTFAWTPAFNQAGAYVVQFTAMNALTGSATTAISIANAGSPPTLNAPSLTTVEELGNLSITVYASDSDGSIASLTADLSSLPAGNDATFTSSPDNTQGTLVWHPALGTAGTYPVTFTATDNGALTASATTSIEVLAVGATVVGDLQWQPAPPDTGSYTVTFTAEDAEGLTTTASTLITVLPELGGALVTLAPHVELSPMRGPIISVASSVTIRAGDQLSLTVSVYPDLSSPLARSSADGGMAPSGPTRGPIISLTANTSELPVTNPATFTVDSDPVLTCPGSIVTEPNQFVTFTVSASDPDGDPLLSLEADLTVLPQGAATFTSNADHTSGTFAWMPQAQDVNATPYAVTFTVANVLYVSATTEITVRAANHAPVADAGGPYSGYVGAPVVFDGTKSSDPDGDALQYSWDFGDGTGGVGPTPSHIYAATLSGHVRLLVTDPGSLTGRDSASIDVSQSIETRTFTWGGNKVLRLRSGKPSWCVQIEPVSFQVSDIDVSSIVMRSEGTGSVPEISSTNGKSGVLKDSDGNGVMELTACFRKDDLVLLFSQVTGRRQVPVEIAGRLVSGATFLARLTVDVVGGSGTLAASVAPNPFNPSTTLSFETRRGGAIELRIFDLAGRLVRDVTRGRVYPPGIHDILIDGRDQDGHRLTSGVYFYRLSTSEGSVTGRLVLLQ